MLCSRGYVWGRLWFPGEVRMVPPIRIICVAIWGIGRWLMLPPQHWLVQLSYPALKGQLENALLGA